MRILKKDKYKNLNMKMIINKKKWKRKKNKKNKLLRIQKTYNKTQKLKKYYSKKTRINFQIRQVIQNNIRLEILMKLRQNLLLKYTIIQQ